MRSLTRPTRPVWLAGSYVARPPLAGDAECDVCVIGGGIGGIATAWGLCSSGLSVLIVEQRTVASGASGRNAGFSWAARLPCMIRPGRCGDVTVPPASTAPPWPASARSATLPSRSGHQASSGLPGCCAWPPPPTKRKLCSRTMRRSRKTAFPGNLSPADNCLAGYATWVFSGC
jgi:hypothetical protein